MPAQYLEKRVSVHSNEINVILWIERLAMLIGCARQIKMHLAITNIKPNKPYPSKLYI
jgi:hypothetical protein